MHERKILYQVLQLFTEPHYPPMQAGADADYHAQGQEEQLLQPVELKIQIEEEEDVDDGEGSDEFLVV